MAKLAIELLIGQPMASDEHHFVLDAARLDPSTRRIGSGGRAVVFDVDPQSSTPSRTWRPDRPRPWPREFQRKFFALGEAPAAKICTYLSYDSVKEIAGLPHLTHVSDSVLDDHCEEAEVE